MAIQNRKKRLAEINVVPYIDVMLVLLIIFMVTAPMLSQGVKVDLPKASAEAIETKEQLPIIATVDKNGLYYLSSESNGASPLSLSNMAIRVQALLRYSKLSNKDRKVLIKGDKAVPYEKVVFLMSALKKAGVEKIGLMTNTPEQLEGIGHG